MEEAMRDQRSVCVFEWCGVVWCSVMLCVCVYNKLYIMKKLEYAYFNRAH